MNEERRTEVEHVIDEGQKLAVECQLQMEKGSGKYSTTDAWLKAGAEFSDKISDLLTEEQDAAAARAEERTEEARGLVSASAHLEDALEDANDAVDALGEADYAAAEKHLEGSIAALRRAMS